MKNRYMSILYAGMVLAAFAASLYSIDRISRSLHCNPVKTRPTSALPMPETELSQTALSDIRRSLEKQEYHVSYDAQKKKLQSPNRRNNIRAYYEPGKLTVQTRVDTTGEGFRMELVNEGIFADGKLVYMPEITAKAEHYENKVQISHGAFTEEFVNNEDGVRQNFIVENAPEGTRELQVRIAAKGLKVEQGTGNELRFFSQGASSHIRNELVYSDLKCWDANRQPLEATLAYADNRIQISVDVTGAAYPVTIDPIIANGTPQNANKVLEINQSNMWLGFSVSSAGDVNGDGYSDVIVGAPHYDKGENNEGGAFVFKGDPSGLTLTAVTFESNQANAEMGYSVSSAGDFNGDGYSDVLVGIPYYDKDAKDEGRANLYLGSSAFFSSPITAYAFGNGHAGALVGITVATAGDINADGFSDVLIGAAQDTQGQSKEGTVAICRGSANGNLLSSLSYLQIDQANAQFGYSIAPAGDVDADGFSDIIIGARWYANGQGQEGEGAAFIYRGGGSGVEATPTVIEGNQYDAAMGNKVSSAGDVNGDGYSDVLISAYLYDYPNNKDNGIVNLYFGSPSGIGSQQQPVRTFSGKDNDHMGSSIACAGDVNGDGYSDILLGAEYYDNGQFNEGAIFVYQGSKDGIVGDPVSTMESNQGNGWFGTAVASAGDVNGDGYSDILVGCYTYDNGQTDEGHVFVYHGGAEGIGTNGAVTLSGTDAGAGIGFSVADAGDVNGDGFDDVIVGAPYFDYNGLDRGVAIIFYGSINGIEAANQLILSKDQKLSFFGGSLAGAGDVNGDGYGDVIVGASHYSNNENNEGVAFIYYGSKTGINPGSAQLLEKNSANSGFGVSVSGAGDINRDGYADIIIGSPYFDPGQGKIGAIYVYYGSNAGPVNPATIQGDPGDSRFGIDVSAAGDVNGDGYGDIIVGANNKSLGETSEGAAYIFLGSSGGINSAGKVLQCNQMLALFGTSVSGVGDVNGDGYGDAIVGAPYYDNGESLEGVAFIYYGNSSGDLSANPTLLEINKAHAQFGNATNGAGDVNGDGYSDVIIGASKFADGEDYEGKAFVYHGSPTGIKSTPSFSIESNEIEARLGAAVSGAGDVNGDGYSDIIIGSPDANNNQTNDVGNATIYYGNNGKGLKNNVRLFNSDLVTPINHSQFSQPNFLGSLSAKSFIGRGQGKLVWETRGPGVPFSKAGNNPITTSNQFTGISSNTGLTGPATVLGSLITKVGISTKVRVRVRYSPALAITGQMYGPWRYVQSQLAGYNNAPVPEDGMTETIQRKAEPEIETSVSLFPNPASNRLSIQVPDPSDVHSIRLYNASGMLVFQSQQYEKDIDVSKFPGGVYILMLDRASGIPTSHRIMIRR